MIFLSFININVVIVKRKRASEMSGKATGRDLIGNKQEKTVQMKQLLIQGHLLRWEGVIIQISNISLITSTNLNPPRFPIWAAIAVLAGISLLDPIWYVGLIAMAVGGYSIYSWYSEYEEVKSHKYLNTLLEISGVLIVGKSPVNNVISRIFPIT